ncbi:MAG: NADH:flavin oxidoreductase [Promethearchaeota archaeon]|nr:MAG: NADH:flavin oxidoreductase [Candidatus Lokiarchaeota archaeon]
MKYLKLFSPLKIGNLDLPNRIVMPAMHLNLADRQYMTQELADFYIARAKGGCGFLIVGGCSVNDLSSGGPFMITLKDDKYIPKLKDFTTQVHGAWDKVKVCAQLYHSGGYSFPELIGQKPVSSSERYSRFSKATSKAMTHEEIKREQEAIASAALRTKKADFDAVEICGSAGYLMDQFLSPLVNKRTDEYGGSLENRLRFPIETIKLIRKYVGEDYIVGMRMAGEDYMGPESNTYETKPPIAKAYEEAGIDYINVTGGWHEARVPQLISNVPEGCYTYLAENIKKAVNVPVFASNRLQNPEIAEETLQADKADAICIGRGLIADPELPNKAKSGNVHDIMHCVGCNQGCFDSVFYLKTITCLRNARAANERKTRLRPLKEKKKVMIVGAGSAGLEASRVAAIRGHDVHLFEQEDNIGGLLDIVYKPPGREDFKKIIEDYDYWIRKYRIHLNLNTKVTIEEVKEFSPDVVLIATGASPVKPPIKGIEREHVYSAHEALAGKVPIGKNCVIIGGGATGIELALHLAEYGALSPEAFKFLMFYRQYHGLKVEDALTMLFKGNKKITVLEMLPKAGRSLGKSTKWALLDKCDMLGVDIFTSVNVTEIEEDSIQYKDANENLHILDNIDAVYYATGVSPNDALYNKVKKLGIEAHKIGDVRKPETIVEAVARAYKIANRI